MEIHDSRIKEYKEAGPLELNIEEVVKKWNKNTCISKYHNEYRLIEFLRKNSSITKLKINIYAEQAKELIEILNLQETKSPILKNASMWRKKDGI